MVSNTSSLVDSSLLILCIGAPGYYIGAIMATILLYGVLIVYFVI